MALRNGFRISISQPQLMGALFPEQCVELIQAGLTAIIPAKPDVAMLVEIAYHDPIGMAVAERSGWLLQDEESSYLQLDAPDEKSACIDRLRGHSITALP